MIESVIGPYRIIRLLGEGGMGNVYEAVNESIERRVAIKVLHSEYANRAEIVKRFLNEARAVNRISHPSIVQIHEQGRLPDGTAYIVMEFLEGQTLSQRLKQVGGRLPQRLSLGIAWQVAAALAAAHAKGIVHSDLNPNNLMLVPDPLGPGGERVKVLDFGIAKLVAEAHGKASAQPIMGTPTYMSPEQCHGADTVDEKTDVYALGAVLFEMLAGRPPFVGTSATELIGMHLFRPPPPLAKLTPQVPAELATFVASLLVKDKSQRPSMEEVSNRLADLAAAEGGVLAPLPRQPTAPQLPVAEPPPPESPPSVPVAPRADAASTGLRLADEGEGQEPRPRTRHRLIAATLTGGALAAGALLLARPLFLHAPAPPRVMMPAVAVSPPDAAAVQVGAVPAAPAPPRPSRPANIKLPPLRLDNVQPIEPSRPAGDAPPPPSIAKAPAATLASTEKLLSDAQNEYKSHNYSKAIEIARSVLKASPMRAWRIIGSAACGLNDTKLIRESYLTLDATGRQYLLFICQRSNINIESLIGPAKK